MTRTTALIDDALLPAAAFLTSEAAADVLAPALAAAGAHLLECRPVQVQYRPGSDLVVRYAVAAVGTDGSASRSTVLAGTTVTGPHAGTLPVQADLDGQRLVVGVWRWPFDPLLPGLERAVTPSGSGPFAEVLRGRLELDVVVYRPTERAVVRACDPDGRCVYAKVVPPHLAGALATRHRALLDAGLPVPEVLAADTATGVLVLAELRGPTLRDLVKSARGRWPPAAEFGRLRAALASARVAAPATRASRRTDARAHAAMLAAVLPGDAGRLMAIVERIDSGPASSRTAVIHGDLHEAQVIVADGRVVGLLDVDDVGAGDAIDDLATLLGHLRYRAATQPAGDARDALHAYIVQLRDRFGELVAAEGDHPAALDLSTAAVLLGLATGPFRIQSDDWATTTRKVVDVADRLSLETTRAGEITT